MSFEASITQELFLAWLDLVAAKVFVGLAVEDDRSGDWVVFASLELVGGVETVFGRQTAVSGQLADHRYQGPATSSLRLRFLCHCPTIIPFLPSPLMLELRPVGRRSSGVEHIHGKDGVTSSNLVVGSKNRPVVFAACFEC